MYVLICHGNGRNDGRYVAPDGNHFAYTADLRQARRFRNKEHADSNKCGNEGAVTVESQLTPTN